MEKPVYLGPDYEGAKKTLDTLSRKGRSALLVKEEATGRYAVIQGRVSEIDLEGDWVLLATVRQPRAGKKVPKEPR